MTLTGLRLVAYDGGAPLTRLYRPYGVGRTNSSS
jgi:hypothetical protein